MGGCLFTQSHADHMIGLQDEKSLSDGVKVLKTALVKGKSCTFSLTGKTAL